MRAALLLVAGVLVLAACGGAEDAPEPDDATAAYLEEIRVVEQVVRGAADRFAAAQADPAQFEEVAAEVAEDLREAADRVARVEPPDEAAGPHEQLRDALQRAADRAETRDEQGLTEALGDVEDALVALEDAGFEVRRRT